MQRVEFESIMRPARISLCLTETSSCCRMLCNNVPDREQIGGPRIRIGGPSNFTNIPLRILNWNDFAAGSVVCVLFVLREQRTRLNLHLYYVANVFSGWSAGRTAYLPFTVRLKNPGAGRAPSNKDLIPRWRKGWRTPTVVRGLRNLSFRNQSASLALVFPKQQTSPPIFIKRLI